jgi:hypothetical protein
MSKRITSFDFYLQYPKMFVNKFIDEEIKQAKLFTQLYVQLKTSLADHELGDTSDVLNAFGDKCCENGIEPDTFRRQLKRQLYNQMIEVDLPKDLISRLTKEILSTQNITSEIIVIQKIMKELNDMDLVTYH